jgi:hypothetical protein
MGLLLDLTAAPDHELGDGHFAEVHLGARQQVQLLTTHCLL